MTKPEKFDLAALLNDANDPQNEIALKLARGSQEGPEEVRSAWQSDIAAIETLPHVEARLVLGQLAFIDQNIRSLTPGYVDPSIEILRTRRERKETIKLIHPFLPENFEV